MLVSGLICPGAIFPLAFNFWLTFSQSIARYMYFYCLLDLIVLHVSMSRAIAQILTIQRIVNLFDFLNAKRRGILIPIIGRGTRV